MSDLRPGDIFDRRYRILRKLGEGGFATVHLGEHVDLGNRVAIKRLKESRSHERFVREGKVLLELKSPYTVRMRDFGRDVKGRPFIVFDYVDGTPLDEAIANRGRFAPAEALPILMDILASLAEAHQLGIVHRDLKPSNIFLTSDGEARVLDFGIAKLLPQVRDVSTQLTAEGRAIGTLRYMAPEQMMSGTVDSSTDMFSLGLIAFEMLHGRRANNADGEYEIVARQLSDSFDFDSIALDPKVREFLTSMVARNVHMRPRDARMARLELESLLDRIPPDTPPRVSTTSSGVSTTHVEGLIANEIVLASWARGFAWMVSGSVYWVEDEKPVSGVKLPADLSASCIDASNADSALVGCLDGRVGRLDRSGRFEVLATLEDAVVEVAAGSHPHAATASGSVYSLSGGQVIEVAPPIHALAVSRSGSDIAIASGKTLELRSPANPSASRQMHLDQPAKSVVFSPDDYLVAVLTESELVVANAVSLKAMVRFQNNRGPIKAIRFTIDGRLQTATLEGTDQLVVASVY